MAGKPVAASCRCGCWLLLWGCVCRWAAARPRFVVPSMREPSARSGRSRSPARPRRRPPAPRPGPASWCPLCASLRLGVVDLEARPSPPTLRHPPHRWGFSLLCTSHPGPAAHGPRRQAPQPGLSCPAAHASPSTPAVPGVLVGDRRRFEGRPGPAAAPGYRSWAPAGGCMPCVGFQSGPLGGLQHEDLAGGVSPTCRVLV